ncbi:zinc finger and SCAN domain-containing protein 12-like [Pelobates fuscus]|uniref:zinc finger and SCAN domain-containing protein 12-like n=1 Tax=Pelobates fuscus TaxID=191477 RepID=UPI002FE467BF
MAVRAQRFHAWTFNQGKPIRSQMFDLINLARKWLQPEINTASHIMELLVMDRFLQGLPASLCRWVSQSDPQSADELIGLVERYVAADDRQWLSNTKSMQRVKTPAAERPGKIFQGFRDTEEQETYSQRPHTPLPRNVNPGKGARWGTVDNIKCFRCNEPGHKARDCPMINEPMQCNMINQDVQLSCLLNYMESAVANCSHNPQICSIRVNGKEVRALLDSGSMATLITKCLVPERDIDAFQKIGIICVHGDKREYPTVLLKFESLFGTVNHRVGVVDKLAYDVVLGRDFPQFLDLWGSPGKNNS